MKIVTDNTTTIERIGVGTDQAFKINFDAKMARILADGLYSDKVQSVIRELSCNAYDSHVMAGCADRPIEVHFPNRFEPWFHVQDFGTGLSHEDILNIYTTYGASTKTQSNEVIGQLGLGSKSPFALTDAFTVTARKDGVENHYSCYRNEVGMPSVAHLHSKPTTEANGVCVTVPVRSDQREEFMNKAREVYKWFPVKPAVVGDTVTYPTTEYSYQGTGWSIRKPTADRRGYYGNRTVERPVAVMGLVAYPLDISSIKNLPEGAAHLMSTPVVLNFAIGELEVAANREALGYDDRTCANIVAKIEVMIRELGEKFEQEIATAKSLWYARQRFGEIFSKHEYAYEFSNAYRNLGLKWKNEVVKGASCLIKLDELYPKIKVGTSEQVESDVYEATWRYKRPRKINPYNSSSHSVDCDANTVIMFNDLKLGGISRVMEYSKAHDNKKHVVIFNPSTRANWTKIQRALGNPDVIYTSTLAKPERAKRQTTGMLKFNGNSYGGKKAWSEVEIDLEQGGYYVELDGWDVVKDGKVTADLNYFIRQAKAAGIIAMSAEVYAMRYKNKKLVKEHTGWKEIFTEIKTQLDKKIASSNLAQEIADTEEFRKMCDRLNWNFWEQPWALRKENGMFAEFCNCVNSVRTNSASAQLEGVKNLAHTYQMTFDKVEPQHKFCDMLTALINRYPMLNFVLSKYRYNRPDSDERVTVLNYINFVDECYVFYAMQDEVETVS